MSSNRNDTYSRLVDLYSRLTGLGYEGEHVIRLLSLQSARLLSLQSELLKGTQACLDRTKQILQRKQAPLKEDDLKIIIAIPRSESEVFPHEDVLMPEWKKLADALHSMPVCVNKQGYIDLTLSQVPLSKDVATLLLHSLEISPIRVLRVWGNNIDSDCIALVANTVKINGTLECLDIRSNRIESDRDFESFVHAAVDHPQIESVFIDECGLGKIKGVAARIAPLLCLKKVGLEGNFIGSDGARVIANSLANNSCVEHLYLNNNLLGDGDARMFADSLETNTNLQVLTLKGNQITSSGARVLSRALVNFSSLNAMNQCNHTCMVDLGDEDLLVKQNKNVDPGRNREMKLLNLLICGVSILYTADLHIEIMPRIIDFIQRQGLYDIVVKREGAEPYKFNPLNAVYMFVREWNMPLLYTSCIGPKVRRSERIRKNKVTQLLRK